jgi:murein DD-endopeptidase MepM/ murein hydrolase activator NlpD
MKASQSPAPVTMYGSTQGEGSAGVHTVVGNETLWDVSQRYQLAMRDIAAVNDLAPPFDLASGQRLRLPPPREYRVRSGDSLYAISRMFNVSTSDIAHLNNLKEPYALEGGETLRLPTLTSKTVAVPVARKPLPPEGAVQTPPRQPADVYAGSATPPPVGKPEILTSSASSIPVAPPDNIKPEPIHVAKAPEEPPAKKTPITAQVPKRSSSRFLKPVEGKIISAYGPKEGGLHNDGMNIRAAAGTPVKAAENGVVVYAGNELEASGNLVIIRHQDRWMTAYAHMDKVLIKRGDTVKRGQSIGTVGSTGSVDSPQLHFEVRRGTEAINPKLYLEG